LPLVVGQVAGGHIVRNLRLLRRINETRKTRDIFLAKHLCESHYICNMFCNAREARA